MVLGSAPSRPGPRVPTALRAASLVCSFSREHMLGVYPGGCQALCLWVRFALPSPQTPMVSDLRMNGAWVGGGRWGGLNQELAVLPEEHSCSVPGRFLGSFPTALET